MIVEKKRRPHDRASYSMGAMFLDLKNGVFPGTKMSHSRTEETFEVFIHSRIFI